MPNADFNQLIWNNLIKIVIYNYLLFHICYIVSLIWKCYMNTELCNVQDLYSACATSQSHVANSWNVNNRWDRCLANDRIHTEFWHFLLQSYFGILAQIKMYYIVFLFLFLYSFLNSCGCPTAKSKTPPQDTPR